MKVKSSAILIVLLAALGAASLGHAQTPADPLGTIQSSSVACQGLKNGGTCLALDISCPQLPDYTAYIKLVPPTVATNKGTAIFVTGGGATDLLELRPFGPLVMQRLRSGGYGVAEVSYGAPFATTLGWQTNANGAGVRAAACRFATVIQWVHDNFQNAGTPLCAAGNSAGAQVIGESLAHYGSGDLLAFAELTSGPPFGRVDYACENTQPVITSPCSGDKSGLGVQPGASIKFIDPAYPGAWCSSSFNSHSKVHDAVFLNDSVTSPDGVVSYPKTFVNFLFGQLDNTSAIRQGLLYEGLITSPHAMMCVTGAPHEMEDSMPGAQQVAADFIRHCKLPPH